MTLGVWGQAFSPLHYSHFPYCVLKIIGLFQSDSHKAHTLYLTDMLIYWFIPLSIYWVGQNVRSSLSSKPFGQPNICWRNWVVCPVQFS